MMSRALASLAFAAALAACGHRTPPGGAPAPIATASPSAPQNEPRIGAAPDTSRQPAVALSDDEIERRAADVFGDATAGVANPDSVASGPAADEVVGPTWDIDVHSYETHERVEHYVQLFTGSARERMVERLERGTRYDAMARAKFRAAGLPEDMTYLALIESGYNPHAYSRAAAVGMWQFMSSTARGMGLRLDWWVDERRDPIRSTDAAIRFLSYLKDQLGSFYLAAAAYNGGPGRVSRGLTRFADDLEGTTGDDVFFALAEKDYLPAETKNYVPQLIAAALVGKEPAKYGLSIRPRPPFAYDSVRVGPFTPLAAVARATGVELADVVELNPHLLRGVTPPEKGTFVRVPVGEAAGFDSAFAALDRGARAAFTTVESKKRQSLAGLARSHGLTARQLAWYNPGLKRLKSGNLRPGQTIRIPSAAVVAAALDVPDPSIERYGTSKTVKLHIVRRGESLGLIARKYGTTVARLKALNGLRKATIFPGQALVVKGTPAKKARAATAKKSAGKATAQKGVAKKNGARKPSARKSVTK